MNYKERQHRIWDSLENTLKLTLRYIEQTNPHTNQEFACLKTYLTPKQWKKHVYQWDKIKNNLEYSLKEIKEYKGKDDRDLGDLTELSYELRERKNIKEKK